MIEFFTQLFLALNKILFNNLGITIIVISILSRLVTHPFVVNSLKYTKAMRDLKPKLDELKKKHGSDVRKLASEQSRLMGEHGVSPTAGLVGCLSIIVQIAVFFILFNVITRVVKTDIGTNFLFWDLAKPDVIKIASLPFPLPGILVALTAIASFVQSKMMMPSTTKTKETQNIKEEKQGIMDALAAAQGQTAFIIPIIIVIWGIKFGSGLILYWLVSTLFGIIQQNSIQGKEASK